MTVDELQVLITADSQKLQTELETVKKKLTNMEQSASKSVANISKAFVAKAGVIAGSMKLVTSSVKSSLDFISNDMMFQNTMQKWADSTREWTEDLRDKLGISRHWMRSSIATIYNMSSSLGMGSDNAYRMSRSIAMLSQDMANFYGLSPDVMFEKLQSGLAGNVQPLRQLGVMVNDATVKQVAYAHGIAQTGAELSEQQKVAARYIAILEQTTTAQGDLARSIDTPNAQIRMLQGNLRTLSYTFGNLFLPAIQAVLPWLNALARVATEAVNALLRLFGINTNNVQKGTSSVAVNMDKANDRTENMDKNMKKANESAKRLNNTIGGFDEINLVQDQQVGGLGNGLTDGNGGGLGDFELPDLSGLDSALDGIHNKAEEIAQSILNWFSGLDTKNLEDSFFNLGQSVLNFGDLAGRVFGTFLHEFLIPISGWFIENVVPVGLDLIAVAIDTVNLALEILWAIIEPLYLNVIKPFGEFLGAILSPVLAGVSDGIKMVSTALKGMRDWVKENTKVLDKFLSPVKEWLNKATEWVKENEFLNGVLYDFGVVLGIAMAAVVAFKTALLVYNGVVAITKIAVIGLGTAFKALTGPLGLAVVGIAAVITVGKLLSDNWEVVGKVLDKVFKGIANGLIFMVNTAIKGIELLCNVMLAPLNAVIAGLNIVPGVNIPKVKVAIPKIPYMAQGGIVDRATLAVIGEDGKEAVVPLENNTGWMDKMATRIADKTEGGVMGGNVTPELLERVDILISQQEKVIRAIYDTEAKIGDKQIAEANRRGENLIGHNFGMSF
jgi:hypothetical protein